MRSLLSDEDIAGIEQVSETLLSPMDYQSTGAWQFAVTSGISRLLGAGSTVFRLPAPSIVDQPWSSDALDLSIVLRYPQELVSLKDAISEEDRWARMVGLGVWDRPRLHQRFYPGYLASPYYNEYLVPLARSAFGVGMTWLPGGSGLENVVSLHPNRSVHDGDFDEREMLMLRLLFPSFKAGTRAAIQLDGIRDELPARIDELQTPVAVFRGSRLLHRNTAMSGLLADEPAEYRERLERAIERFANPPNGAEREVQSPVFSTPSGRYRLEAIQLGEHRFDDSPTLLVQVVRVGRSTPKISTLLSRWSLTGREFEVAELLAKGMTNKKIGAELEISSHTVKRHVESIFKKLEIQRRSELLPTLRAAAASERGEKAG